MATPRLIELIDRYRTTHGMSESELARRIGVTRENLRKWRINGVRRLPDHANLVATARVIGQPYREVLSAALHDTGYLDAGTDGPRPYGEILRDAIDVLTEASRLTNQPMRKSSAGEWEPDPDPRAALSIDWAAFVTDALAGAAANAGGIDAILAGRPGSWEAKVVGDALRAAVGDDESDLWRHRTEPVVVDLWVEGVLDYLGDSSDDAYNDAQLELEARAEAVPEPTDLPPGTRPGDPRIAATNWVSVDDSGYLDITYTGWTGDPADVALLAELSAEAEAHHDPTPGEVAHEEAMQAISAINDALDDQWRREYDSYAARLSEAVQRQLADLELTVPIVISITRAPESYEPGAFEKHAPPPYPRNAIEAAIEKAITDTATPAALSAQLLLERAEAALRRPSKELSGD